MNLKYFRWKHEKMKFNRIIIIIVFINYTDNTHYLIVHNVENTFKILKKLLTVILILKYDINFRSIWKNLLYTNNLVSKS